MLSNEGDIVQFVLDSRNCAADVGEIPYSFFINDHRRIREKDSTLRVRIKGNDVDAEVERNFERFQVILSEEEPEVMYLTNRDTRDDYNNRPHSDYVVLDHDEDEELELFDEEIYEDDL